MNIKQRINMLLMMPKGMADTFWSLHFGGKIIFILYFIPINLIVLWRILFYPIEKVYKLNEGE